MPTVQIGVRADLLIYVYIGVVLPNTVLDNIHELCCLLTNFNCGRDRHGQTCSPTPAPTPAGLNSTKYQNIIIPVVCVTIAFAVLCCFVKCKKSEYKMHESENHESENHESENHESENHESEKSESEKPNDGKCITGKELACVLCAISFISFVFLFAKYQSEPNSVKGTDEKYKILLPLIGCFFVGCVGIIVLCKTGPEVNDGARRLLLP